MWDGGSGMVVADTVGRAWRPGWRAVRSWRLIRVALTKSRCSPGTEGAPSSEEDGAQAWYVGPNPAGDYYLNTSLTFSPACLRFPLA